ACGEAPDASTTPCLGAVLLPSRAGCWMMTSLCMAPVTLTTLRRETSDTFL
ncbi:unnamed protein product, partial [Ectocarpus sp. 12 AP-2014]